MSSGVSIIWRIHPLQILFERDGFDMQILRTIQFYRCSISLASCFPFLSVWHIAALSAMGTTHPLRAIDIISKKGNQSCYLPLFEIIISLCHFCIIAIALIRVVLLCWRQIIRVTELRCRECFAGALFSPIVFSAFLRVGR